MGGIVAAAECRAPVEPYGSAVDPRRKSCRRLQLISMSLPLRRDRSTGSAFERPPPPRRARPYSARPSADVNPAPVRARWRSPRRYSPPDGEPLRARLARKEGGERRSDGVELAFERVEIQTLGVNVPVRKRRQDPKAERQEARGAPDRLAPRLGAGRLTRAGRELAVDSPGAAVAIGNVGANEKCHWRAPKVTLKRQPG
jgi:hypothetical protein